MDLTEGWRSAFWCLIGSSSIRTARIQSSMITCCNRCNRCFLLYTLHTTRDQVSFVLLHIFSPLIDSKDIYRVIYWYAFTRRKGREKERERESSSSSSSSFSDSGPFICDRGDIYVAHLLASMYCTYICYFSISKSTTIAIKILFRFDENLTQSAV